MDKLRAMWVVVPRDKTEKVLKTFRTNNSNFQYTLYGRGTISKELANNLGLSDTSKSITVGVISEDAEEIMFAHLHQRLKLDQPGNGIVFTVPIKSVVGTYSYRFLANDLGSDKMEEKIAKKPEKLQLQKDFVLIVAVVNVDSAEKAIEASKTAGARGATIINAHGSGSMEANLLFGFSVSPEKEVVIFLVERKIKDAVMKAVAEKVGLSREGHGIIFSQDVEAAYGIVGENG